MGDSKPLQADHQAELKILQARVKELESKEQQYRQAEVAEHRFQQQLMDLLDINIQLSKIDSFDDFCRQAVELCRNRLGFDRAGLLFFSEEDPNIVVGTFGTDDKGQTRDEHHLRLSLDEVEKEMLATRHREKIVEHAEVKILSIRQEAHIDRLCEVSMKIFPSFEKPLATLMINKPFYRASGEYIGAGTLIRASIWAGDEIIGYLSVDNKLSLKPFVDHDCELLALYASILGHLYSRKKAEVKLHEADRQIKKEVTDRKQVEEAKSESEKAEQRFRQRLTALIEVGNELSEIDSFDDLCRQAVELGLSRLDFDRLGMWFFTEDPHFAVGSFGTDENRKIRDERNQRVTGFDQVMLDGVLNKQKKVWRYDGTITDVSSKILGEGTQLAATIWDGTEVIGYLNMDNLLRQRPITDHDCELLSLYASTLGHLCSRQRTQQALRKSEEMERNFQQQLTNLLDISVQLSKIDSFDDFCREAVELSRDKLNFDRVGMWFISKEDPDFIKATFGTDEDGNIRDERHIQDPIDELTKEMIVAKNRHVETDYYDTKMVHMMDAEHNQLCKIRMKRFPAPESPLVAIITNKPFYDKSGKYVGAGIGARASIWDGEEMIGYVSFDNRLKRRPITDHDCQLLALLASTIGHLVSLRRTEEALRERERTLKAVTDSAMDGIIMMDQEGKVSFFNPAAEKIFGYTADEIIGRDLHLAIAPTGYHADYLKGIKHFAETGEGEVLGKTLELTGRRKDGTEFPIELSVSHPMPIEGRLYVAGVVRDITRRKRAEQALQESEIRIRTLFERAPIGIAVVTMEGQILACNDSIAQTMGYTKEELQQINPRDTYVDPADRDRLLQRFQTEGSVRDYEVMLKRKDGVHFYANLTVNPFVFDGKEVLLTALEDITERKRAEQALQESELRFRTLFERAPIGLGVANLDGQILACNRSIAQTLGYTEEELKQLDVRDTYYNPEDRSQLLERFKTEGFVRDYDVVLRRKDGTPFYGSLTVNPFTLDGKDAVLTAIEDITERKQAAEALQRAHDELEMRVRERTAELTQTNKRLMKEIAVRKRTENALRLTQFSIDHTAEAAYWIGPDARFVYVNEAACRSLGYSREEFLNMTVHDIDPNYPREKWPDHWKELKERRSFTIESEHHAKDGTVIPVEISLNYMKYDDREYNYAFARDITERKELQRQLLQSQKLESIGTLAGGIAHDFNNLLAVIMGQASIHQRDTKLPDKLLDSLHDIVSASERGSALTNQLLAYARGGLQKPEPVNLNEIIRSVLRMLRRTTPPQIEMVTVLGEDLPAIIADPTQIEQVVMNLCLNAIQASLPPSEIKISTVEEILKHRRAKLLELEKGRYICIRVEDHGCGMDTETVERIFEPFFSTKIMGRGMGLAAALGIIHSHNGQIRAESTPGGGTTMSVWLPAAKEEAVFRSARPQTEWEEPPQGSETVLVIDDDEAVARTVEQILSSLGYCVVSHTDADDATAFMDTNFEDINLVLMNLNIPKCSSDEMLERIKQRCPHAPVLLASGFDDRAAFTRLIEKGAVGYVNKPFSMMILAKAIRKALDERPESVTHADRQ